MNLVPSTLDQAILEINGRRNKAIFCSITASSDEIPKKTLMSQEPFNEPRLRSTVESAFMYYPNCRISLEVYAPNGSRNKLSDTYLLINPNQANDMSGIIPSYNQQPQQNQNSQLIEGLGLNGTANYLLNEKAQQINDLKEQLRELRDTNRMHEQTIREEREKRWRLEQDLSLKDREFNLEKLEIEASTSKGLNGLVDRATSVIEAKPELLGVLISALTNKAIPMQIGSVPDPSPVEHLSTEAQNAYNNLTSWLQGQPEQAIGEFYAVALLVSQNKLNLSQIISSTQHV